MTTDQEQRAAQIELIRRRRVTRAFTAEPVPRDLLIRVAETARWAPSAGNRRIHTFVIIDQLALIQKIRMLTPGMLGQPTALVVICTDWQRAAQAGVKRSELNTWVDVGTATQNMLLAAAALGLGAGPVTSFSRSGVSVLLRLPEHVAPELMICLGFPAPEPRVMREGASTLLKATDLCYWNGYANRN